MFDHFMFKVGVKIGPWPFWTYIWEGGGELTVFPPPSTFRPPSRPMSRPMSRPLSRPMFLPTCESMPIYWVFRFFGGLLELFSTQVFMKNCVSLLYFLLRSGLRWKFSPPAAKKWKPKDSILPRWGVKKQQSLFPPQKNLLARAKEFGSILCSK